MKKTFFFALMCMVGLTMTTACGGSKDNKGATEAAPADNETTTEQVAGKTEATATDSQSDAAMDVSAFAEQVKEVCGLAPFTTEKMTNVKVWYEENEVRGKQYYMTSPVTDDIDGEALQREYYNAFAKVADGGKMYGFHMDQTRGTDVFKDYDEYVKFIKANGDYAKAMYGYDYNGKPIQVNCSVSFGDFGLTVTLQ